MAVRPWIGGECLGWWWDWEWMRAWIDGAESLDWRWEAKSLGQWCLGSDAWEWVSWRLCDCVRCETKSEWGCCGCAMTVSVLLWRWGVVTECASVRMRHKLKWGLGFVYNYKYMYVYIYRVSEPEAVWLCEVWDWKWVRLLWLCYYCECASMKVRHCD